MTDSQIQSLITDTIRVTYGKEEQVIIPLIDETAGAEFIKSNQATYDAISEIIVNGEMKVGEENTLVTFNALLVNEILKLTPQQQEHEANLQAGLQPELYEIEKLFAARVQETATEQALEQITEEAVQQVAKEAAAGNSVAEAITNLPASQQAEASQAFMQLSSVMQFGAEGLNHVVARRKLKAQEEALETAYLEKLATMLHQAPAEIAAQLQAAGTSTVPANVPA